MLALLAAAPATPADLRRALHATTAYQRAALRGQLCALVAAGQVWPPSCRFPWYALARAPDGKYLPK